MSHSFEQLGIRHELTEVLKQQEIDTPSDIQTAAIPAIAAGKDCLVRSITGSGKTLAYLLPILQRIDPQVKQLQAIVLAPSRELAMQIARESEKYGEALGLVSQALIGGASTSRQVERLKEHPQIIIGTPGRVKELITLRKLKMHTVRTLVVDEADHILAEGLVGDLESIVKSTLRDRQMILVSATIPDSLQRLAQQWMNNPEYIQAGGEERVAPTLEHQYVVCEEREKIDVLRKLVRSLNPKRALIFVNEIEPIAIWVAKLQYVGLQAEAIYGDMPKQERTTVLQRFREGRFQLLIATDVAGRGLDIDQLTHVFHYDPAPDADHYVHRAGRTGRMGRQGTNISLITRKQLFILDKFAKQLGIQFQELRLAYGRVHDAKAKRFTAPSQASVSGTAEKTSKPKQQSKPARSVKPATPPPKQKDREQDRKNKGAPKWLKAKREQ